LAAVTAADDEIIISLVGITCSGHVTRAVPRADSETRLAP